MMADFSHLVSHPKNLDRQRQIESSATIGFCVTHHILLHRIWGEPNVVSLVEEHQEHLSQHPRKDMSKNAETSESSPNTQSNSSHDQGFLGSSEYCIWILFTIRDDKSLTHILVYGCLLESSFPLPQYCCFSQRSASCTHAHLHLQPRNPPGRRSVSRLNHM
jgi:hypothetical protein